MPEGVFGAVSPETRTFLNCARTWCAQAGILDRKHMDGYRVSSEKNKNVNKLVTLLNRLLGMNLQQQQIVFGCGHSALSALRMHAPHARSCRGDCLGWQGLGGRGWC